MTTAALLDDLRALPQERLELRVRGGTRVYRGPSLFAYAVAAGFIPEDAGDALAGGYFIVRAEDGAKAAVALAEIAPSMSDRRVILATEQDGEPLNVGVRLVVPREGIRSLLAVATIEFYDIGTEAISEDVTATTQLEVRGAVPRPGDLDVAAIATEQPTEVTTVPGNSHGQPIPSRQYSGVAIQRLLTDAGTFYMTDGEDLAHKVIVARGADGHRALLAASEFGPLFGDNPAIAATMRDGQPLDASEGPVRLVVPYDRMSARWVQHLVGLEVRYG